MKENEKTRVKAFVREKPVISIAYYDGAKWISCGAAWDNGWKAGALKLKLDLTSIPDAFNSSKLKVKCFVKESFKTDVLLEHIKSIESKFVAKLSGSEKSTVPLYDITINSESGSIRVGCVWGGSLESLVLHAEIHLNDIPENLRRVPMTGALFKKRINTVIPEVRSAV